MTTAFVFKSELMLPALGVVKVCVEHYFLMLVNLLPTVVVKGPLSFQV